MSKIFSNYIKIKNDPRMYSKITLSHLLKPVLRVETVDPHKIYNIVGVKWYAKGLFIKSTVMGNEIKADKLYKIKTGDFIYNRLFAWKGSFALVSDEFNDCYVSGEFPVFEINKSRIIPEYLLYFFMNETTWEIASSLSKGGSSVSRNRLNVKNFLSIEIMLNQLESQKKIVQEITVVLQKLGEIAVLKKDSEINTKDILRAFRAKIFDKDQPLSPPRSIKESILLINEKTENPEVTRSERDFSYIDISSIEAQTGRIIGVSTMKGLEAPSRARRVIRADDVIFSTVRPYLRSIAIIPVELNDQICSTGFAVFTCPKGVNPEFLYQQLMSDFFIDQCLDKMRGAHYPAINYGDLMECKLMFPSIEAQNEIVDFFVSISEKTEELEDRQKETNLLLNSLLPSVLRKFFS